MNKKTHKKCINCKEEFKLYSSTQKFCSFPCKSEYEAKKAQKEEYKNWAKEKAKMKEKLKTHSEYEADLQTEINSIVRLIDRGHKCISSGRTINKCDAGHYFPRSSYPSLKFHLLNIFAQSVNDNQYNSGNIHKYREGIVNVFGEDLLNEIEGLKLKYPILKLSNDELIEKTKLARTIVNSLKIKEEYYSISERIELRKQYNLILGIYLD